MTRPAAPPSTVGRYAARRVGLSTLWFAALVAVPAVLARTAAGQQAPGPSPEGVDTVRETEAALARIERETSCLQAHKARLAQLLDLARQAQAQQQRPGASQAERDAGRDALASLRRQAAEVERAARRCIETGPLAFPASVGAPEVVRAPPPPDATADAVGELNSATEVIERDVALGPYVRAIVGEKVDGLGAASPAAVQRAMRAIAPRLGACYDRLVDRGPLRSGRLVLAFKVLASGAVTQVAVEENRIRDAAFERCVVEAGRAITVEGGSRGGYSTYAYELAFGPQG
jgi:hypothetical protein